jgi:voltage-gated potassium channel Kch
MSADLGLLVEMPLAVIGLTLALMVVKAAIIYPLALAFGLEHPSALRTGLVLSQGGEFAFVLLTAGVGGQVMGQGAADVVVLVITLSMALTPLLVALGDRIGTRREERAFDEIDEPENPVIIAGFGRFGHIVGRLLKANGVGTTVLDLDGEQIDLLRRLGLKVFYGDASRLELLHAAGAGRAKLFVLAIDDERKALELVDTIRKHFPHLTILARASGRAAAYELLNRGVQHVYRETLGSSLDLGTEALRLLGFRAYQAQRAARELKKHDEQAVRDLAAYWGDEKAYVNQARLRIEQFEQAMRNDQDADNATTDQGWEPLPSGDESRG